MSMSIYIYIYTEGKEKNFKIEKIQKVQLKKIDLLI